VKGSKAIETTFIEALQDKDGATRTLAAAALAASYPKPAAELVANFAQDPTVFRILASVGGKKVDGSLRDAGASTHSQAVALPALARSGDVTTLLAFGEDVALTETARLSAIAALASVGSEAAEDGLASLGKNEKLSELLRKEAWRARRRSKRARSQREVLG
jgi:HEAT repeat protein